IFTNSDQASSFLIRRQAKVEYATQQPKPSSISRFVQCLLAGYRKITNKLHRSWTPIRMPNMIGCWFRRVENRYAVEIGSDGLVDFVANIKGRLRGNGHLCVTQSFFLRG